jgi:2-amino-4-hydroxy-6-hydroxymethyldihydropteridine diphosphokinase
MTVTTAVLALGANLGDRWAALQGAIYELDQDPAIDINSISSLYETDPVGGPEQPVYFNAILSLDTSLSAHDLLSAAHEIENSWHRTREVRWDARTLDIDLITYGALIYSDDILTVPHPRAHEREFVLVPWLEIDPDAELPGRGPVAGLTASNSSGAVRKIKQQLIINLSPQES